MKDSPFLTKDDFPIPALLTIRGFSQENVARKGEPAENKWIIYFHEKEKGMVLNSTNRQMVAKITGTEQTGPDDSIGKKIVAYNEPSVTDLSGKVVGGIRFRAPRGQAAQTAPAPAPEPSDNDEVPL